MKRSILDTSVLIRSWWHYSGGVLKHKTPSDARSWAIQTIGLYDTNAIVTPIHIEMMGRGGQARV